MRVHFRLIRLCRVALISGALILGHSAVAEEFSNFLGMKFVSIPAGSFKMGAPAVEVGVMFNELPQHQVQVPAFQIQKTEVTLAQYKRFILAANRTELVTEPFMDANAFDDNAPVVLVSWNEAKLFLHWLNQNKPANDPGKYTLPTEAEWEYACRAGSSDPFCGSNVVSRVAWHTSNLVKHQQPVAQKAPNAFGLYDMSGNVREWVEDCYHETYDDAPTNGSAWTTRCGTFTRVLRGGSWKEDPQKARVTDRISATVTSRSQTIGFRVVRRVEKP